MLNQRDKLILYALTVNCRFPNSVIAKIANVKPQTVANRIQEFEEEGVIETYYITVFKSAVGIIRYADIWCKGKFSQEQINKIKDIPEVTFLTSYHGFYQLHIGLDCPTNERSREVVQEIKNILGDSLDGCDHFSINYSRYLQRMYFLDKDEESITHLNPKGSFQKEIMKHKKTFPRGVLRFNDTDLKIIEELRTNAKIPLNELAEKAEISRPTVEKKIKNLISTGTVGYFTVYLNYSKLGYHKFFLFLNVKDKEKIMNFIRMNRHAHSHYEYSSNWDLAISFYYKSHEEMLKYIKELHDQFKDLINRYELVTAIQEHKFQSFPPNITQLYKHTMDVIENKPIIVRV